MSLRVVIVRAVAKLVGALAGALASASDGASDGATDGATAVRMVPQIWWRGAYSAAKIGFHLLVTGYCTPGFRWDFHWNSRTLVGSVQTG